MQPALDLRKEVKNMSNLERTRTFIKQPNPERIKNGELVLRPSLPSTDDASEGDRAKIILPTGRLEKDVKNFFKAIGLEFEDTDKKFFIRVENMPVDFVMIKEREVSKLVGNPFQMWGTIGVTGSDILWENARKISPLGKNSGEDLPIRELVADFKKSNLYIGVTNSFAKQIREKKGRDPELKDLATKTIITKLPNIARDVFMQMGIDVKIYRVSGAEESWQYLNQNFVGVVGTTQTGNTANLNNIQILEQFCDVNVRLISADWERYDSRISRNELKILDDLKELTFVALQKKRVA